MKALTTESKKSWWVPTTRALLFLVACILIGSMPVNVALAEDPDCRVSGGGQIQSVLEPLGATRFGGNIRAERCSVTGEVHGMWFVSFADRTRFQTTDFSSVTLLLDGIYHVLILGSGEYEGSVVNFELYVENESDHNPSFMLLNLWSLTGDLQKAAAGDVSRGSLRVDPGH